MAAGQRHPDDALTVDVAAARAEARHRHIVDFGERRRRRVGAGIEPNDRAGIGAQRAPHRAVHRARHDRVEHLADAHVLARLERLAGLGVFAALAVAGSIDDERGPALRLRRVAGLQEFLGVEPADHAAAAAARGPQRVVLVEAELQMVRGEAGVDEGVFHRLRIEHRQLPLARLQREQFCRRQVGTLAAEVRILDAAQRRRRATAGLCHPSSNCGC